MRFLVTTWLIALLSLPAQGTRSPHSVTYTLLGPDAKFYKSSAPGALGGHRRLKLYGQLDCASALKWISKGLYVKHRVFFASEHDALRAGYNPCHFCMGGDVAFRSSKLGGAFVMRLARKPEVDEIIVLPRENPGTIAGTLRYCTRRDGTAIAYEIQIHPAFRGLGIERELLNSFKSSSRLNKPSHPFCN